MAVVCFITRNPKRAAVKQILLSLTWTPVDVLSLLSERKLMVSAMKVNISLYPCLLLL